MKNDLGYECVIQVLRTANVIWRESRKFFRPFGITEAQFNVLNLLGQNLEGMSQRELSDRLLVDRSNVTLLLDKMSKKGLIRRHDVPHDRRAYRVLSTPSGEKLWKRILPHYKTAVRALTTEIPRGEIETVHKILRAFESQANQRRKKQKMFHLPK